MISRITERLPFVCTPGAYIRTSSMLQDLILVTYFRLRLEKVVLTNDPRNSDRLWGRRSTRVVLKCDPILFPGLQSSYTSMHWSRGYSIPLANACRRLRTFLNWNSSNTSDQSFPTRLTPFRENSDLFYSTVHWTLTNWCFSGLLVFTAVVSLVFKGKTWKASDPICPSWRSVLSLPRPYPFSVLATTVSFLLKTFRLNFRNVSRPNFDLVQLFQRTSDS